MLQSLVVAARDRDRLAEILSVCARFGLDGLLQRLGIREARDTSIPSDLPTRVRRALEELGPTYIKLGQILATRRDLLPDEWIEALEHLQNGAPSMPFEALRRQVESSLGEPIETAFASFDAKPLGAASIAQVHRATLHNGADVVLKIRRPGIRPRMEADLRLIRHIASVVETNSADVRRYRPVALVDQLARDILEELDFTNEGRNADLLRADLASNDRVIIPGIHWDKSAEDLLVMDYVAGIPPRNPDTLRKGGIDPVAIASLGAELVMDMVLINGRFHGDPHPGNLLCLTADRLALLDLGSVGFVSPRRQHEFLTFMLGLKSGDPAAVADMLVQWSDGVAVSRVSILSEAERLVARHGGGPLRLSRMMGDFFHLMRRERLVLPPDLLLIFKALVTMDGVLERISPGFDLSQALESLRPKLVASRLADLTSPERSGATLLELARMAEEAPHFLRSAAQWLDQHREHPPSAPDNSHAIVWSGLALSTAVITGALILALA